MNFTYLDRDSFTEGGTAATALTIEESSDGFLALSPAIEIGTDHQANETHVVRFYGKAGVSFFLDNDISLSSQFASGPGFLATGEVDDVFADIEAGITVLDDGNATIEFGFQGRFSENNNQAGGFIKANMKF